jgi:succinoglycan biosynthesis transport protein ExoP
MVEAYRPKAVAQAEMEAEYYWGTSRDYYLTQYEIIKSREFAERLVRVMGLVRHPAFDPRQRPPAWYQKWLPGGSTPAPSTAPVLSDKDVEDGVVAQVLAGTSLRPVRNTQIVNLSFDSPDPQIAERVPNTLATIYIVADLEARTETSRRTSTFLSTQAEQLKAKMVESEAALQSFRDREKIVETKGVSAGAGRQLEALTVSLVEARQKRADAEALHAQIAAVRAGDIETLENLPALQRNSVIQRAREAAAEASRKYSEASKRYGPEHPRLQSATSELNSAQANLRNQVDSAIKTITKEYELARTNEESIERALANSKGEVQSQNRKEFQLQALERDVATNRQLYEQYVQRDRQTRAGNMDTAVARIVDSAALPKAPSGPNKQRIIGLAMLAALLAGISLSILAERLDTNLKSSHEVEARLKTRAIGVVPKAALPEDVAVERLYQESNPNSFSEAIRTVRSALLLSGIESRKQVVLVTSSIPSEGKSTLASNLALSLSEVKKTLLLEGDMRRPSLARLFGEERDRPGLAELVAGGLSPEQCTYQLKDCKLHVMQSGRVPSNPLTLISSPEFSTAMQTLMESFDLIVVDSPPVQLVSDAVVLSQMATAVLFVVKASSTPYPVARHALGRLRRVDASILGTVLNQIDIEMADKYYGEHSGYGDKYYRKYGYHYSKEVERV